MIAFIDSGAKAGLALFEDNGTLEQVFAPSADAWLAVSGGILETAGLGYSTTLATVVFERPVAYPGGRARPNDLITLACRGAYFAGLFRARTVVCVRPDQWKGQVPKAIMHKRILASLTDVERDLLTPAVLKSGDALDAIGIGLKWHERLEGAPAARITHLGGV